MVRFTDSVLYYSLCHNSEFQGVSNNVLKKISSDNFNDFHKELKDAQIEWRSKCYPPEYELFNERTGLFGNHIVDEGLDYSFAWKGEHILHFTFEIFDDEEDSGGVFVLLYYCQKEHRTKMYIEGVSYNIS